MGENTLFALRDISPPADIPIETMTANQCLDFLIHADKNRSFWDALKARALARFADIRQSDTGTGLEEGAPEEVAIELGMNPHTAAIHLNQARDLVTRLPATTAALEAGEIDYVRAKAMTDLTEVLTDAQALSGEVGPLHGFGAKHQACVGACRSADRGRPRGSQVKPNRPQPPTKTENTTENPKQPAFQPGWTER
jgi:hypothetical protein